MFSPIIENRYTCAVFFAKMATKRPADSDQSCSGSSKLARVQDNPHRSSSDEASASGSNEDWPCVFSGNEVVWHTSAHNWLLDVEV